jgi:hypothetical protein
MIEMENVAIDRHIPSLVSWIIAVRHWVSWAALGLMLGKGGVMWDW